MHHIASTSFMITLTLECKATIVAPQKQKYIDHATAKL